MDPPTYPLEETSFMNGPLVQVILFEIDCTIFTQISTICFLSL